MAHWDLSIIKICSMHCLNLGLVYTANGGALTLGLHLYSRLFPGTILGNNIYLYICQITSHVFITWPPIQPPTKDDSCTIGLLWRSSWRFEGHFVGRMGRLPGMVQRKKDYSCSGTIYSKSSNLTAIYTLLFCIPWDYISKIISLFLNCVDHLFPNQEPDLQ